HAASASAIAQFIESGLESTSKLFGRPSAPIMQKDHDGPIVCHVMVYRNHVKSVLPECFQHGCDFTLKHRDISSDRRVLFRTHKSGPVIEAHAGVDRSAMLFHA